MELRSLRRLAAALGVAACPFAPAWAGGTDPLASEVWADIVELEFAGAPVVHDDSFYLVTPERVEEAFSVPVTLGFADTPYEVAEVALFAENNPFPQVARVLPHRPLGGVGFDIRLERSTPVRAAVRDADGVWHVAHRFVEVASPGGCSAASGGLGGAVGEIDVRQFVRTEGDSRIKLRISHPMHTGLATAPDGETIPAWYIERMTLAGDGGPLAELTLWASVAADPTFVFDLPESQSSVRVAARDTAGAVFETAGAPSRM